MDKPSHRPRDDAPSLGAGDRIGRYEIRRAIGQGGMGEVYLAEDTLLHRPVALKRVSMDLAGNAEEQKQRMLGEAQRASSLSDGRIAGVFDFLVEDGEQFLIMEYIPGQTLREILAEPVPLDLFWDTALQCVEALQAAHREGLVHRDIKPENIIRTPAGSVRLIDFGIARRFGLLSGESTRASDVPFAEEPTPTEALPEDKLLGTPAYMAPEALRGEVADRRSDVFALGVVFHEMLAGSRPFRGDTTLSVVAQILHSEPEPLAEVAPHAPRALVTVIQRMLAKDAAHRPSSAGELLEDLVAARRDAGSEATRTMAPVPRRRGFPWMRVALGILGLAVMGGMIELNNPAYRIPVQRFLGMDVLPASKHVAVLPPEMIGKEPYPEAFGAGLTNFLAGELMKLTGDSTLQVASPGLVRYYEVEDAVGARSEMGANLVLRTRLEERGDGWRAELILTDTRHDQTLDTRMVEVGERNALGFAGDVFAASVDMLGLNESRDVASPALATEASGAFTAWLEGMGRLHAAQDSAGLLRAMDDFARAGTIDPECSLSATGLSRAALRMYRLSKKREWLREAETQGRRAVGLDGSRPEARLALARAFRWSGNCVEADAEFNHVIDLNPLSEDGYFQLGRLRESCGDPDRAEAAYRAALRIRPHAWPATWWLGRFYARQGRQEEAEAEYRRLSMMHPDNFRGHVNLGGLLVFTGRYVEGAEALRRALALKHSESALSNLATAHFIHRDFDEAIRGFQEAVDAGYWNHEIWGNLGDAYHWAPGKREHARPPYEQAVLRGREYLNDPARSPQDRALALAYLANIFPKLDEPDSAVVYLDQALALSPDDRDVRYYAALVHWQLDHPEEALDRLALAVEARYPRVWIRDSPVFDAWRGEERFCALAEVGESSVAGESYPNQGG